jgi:hypothetical protein
MKINIFNKDAAHYLEYDWRSVIKGWNAMLPVTVNVVDEFDDDEEQPRRMKVTEVDVGEWRDHDAYHPVMFTAEHITYGPFPEGKEPHECAAPDTLEFVFSVDSTERAVDDRVYTEACDKYVYFSLAELLEQIAPRPRVPQRAPAHKRKHEQVDSSRDELAEHPAIKRRLSFLENRINEHVSLLSDLQDQFKSLRRGLAHACEPLDE